MKSRIATPAQTARCWVALLLLLAACSGQGPTPARVAQVVQPTQAVTACVTVGPSQAGIIQECITNYLTETPTPTATRTATATDTQSPTATAMSTPAPSATPTQAVALAPWHPVGTHLDPISHLPLPIHEHGDPPPDWTARAACVPFSQTREGHVFYKGMLASDKAGMGVLSYMITHIGSTTTATSHGDHDYMAFFLTPGTGFVSCVQGLLDFGSPPPLITATVDPGLRPIILSKGDGYGSWADCETWYSRPGALVFDLGWTICNRWQRLDGTQESGTGGYRGADWHVYVDRFSEWPGMDPNLANFAVDDGFGHKRLDFVNSGLQYDVTGVPGPN